MKEMKEHKAPTCKRRKNPKAIGPGFKPKNSRHVKWNGQVFESALALGRHLRLYSHAMIYNYIRNKKEIKGYVPEYVEETKE